MIMKFKMIKLSKVRVFHKHLLIVYFEYFFIFIFYAFMLFYSDYFSPGNEGSIHYSSNAVPMYKGFKSGKLQFLIF